MNTENIYDAVSGVDQQFVSAADDTDAIRLSFKKNRARKTKIIGSVVCCAVLVLAAGWIGSQNWFGKTPTVTPNETANAGFHLTAPTQTEPTETQPGFIPQETDSTQRSETDRFDTTQNDDVTPAATQTQPTTTTPDIENDTAVPSETNPEPTTQKEDEASTAEIFTDADPSTISGASSYNGQKRLKAAVEENVCGWIRYNDTFFLQDDWCNGNVIENCDLLGNSASVEGNLDILELIGEVFLVTSDCNYSGCLLLRTDTGRNIVFIPVPGVYE